ncbi:MAG: hypothetical protein FWD69_12565 [Polyangiaceae bacterium]|nr:hypothetical protein [Polyangiaceae bacterium]
MSTIVRSPKKSVLRTTLLVLPAQIIFRVGEAILPLLLAFWFGRSRSTDVYYFAWAVFAFAGSLVFTAFQDSAIIPILAEERIARKDEVPKLTGSLLTYAWLLGSAVAAVVGALALGWFAYRYEGPDFSLAAKMVIPFSLYLVATATRTFFGAILASAHHFMVQPVASGVGMLVNITLLATTHARFGVSLVPVSALAGEIVACLVLAWFAIRVVGLRIELGLSRPPALVRFAKLVSAEVGGSAVTRVNPVVDQLMAGLSLVVGGGTMLRYSGDVASLPTSILQASLLPVLLSHLSDDFAANHLDGVRRTVTRALASVMGLLLAATVLLYAVRTPLLRFIFLRGEMDAAGVDRMIHLLPYHLVGLAPFGALLVLARAHVALKNSSIMLGMGIFNTVSNAVFNVVLLEAIGLEGIALSTSCVQAAVAVVFWFRFESRLRVLRSEATA